MNIFLSTPISSFRDEKTLRIYKDEVKELITELKRNDNTVYSEIDKISGEDDYDLPEDSIISDFGEIEKCEVFVMHYPIKTPTSALIELGFALANNKRIVIISRSKNTLPYLAQGICAFNEHSTIIECEDLEKSMHTILSAVNGKRE